MMTNKIFESLHITYDRRSTQLSSIVMMDETNTSGGVIGFKI